MKTLTYKRKLVSLAVLSAGGYAGFANAAGADFSSLSGVDMSGVSTGILAIGAALAGAYVVLKGAKIVLNALKGG